MKAYKFLVLFFLLNACGSVLAEEIYFSCSTKSGIAVLQMNDNNLEYSFDKKGRTIFLFKSKKIDNGSFKYNHYSRFQADYFNVSFINDDYKYLVFSNYEDGQQSQGVTVLNLNNKIHYGAAYSQGYHSKHGRCEVSLENRSTSVPFFP